MSERRQSRSLTRGEVAAWLLVSVSSVRRMEGTKLHPKRDERGVWRFDSEEVRPLAAAVPLAPVQRAQRDPGRLASKVFTMFEHDMMLAEIVIAARLPPEQVRDLYREWTTSLAAGERQRRQDEIDRKEREWRAAL